MLKQASNRPAVSGIPSGRREIVTDQPHGGGTSPVRRSAQGSPGPGTRILPHPRPGAVARSTGSPVPTVDRSVEVPGFGCIRYRMVGRASNPPAVVLGGISADRCIDQWWSAVTGIDGGLSAHRYRLLSMDWPESAGERPTTTDRLADALAGLLDVLGIGCIDSFVGASFGAMVGLAFGARHPARLDRLVAISGAHRSTPAATAGRILQREILMTLAKLGAPERGVALARGLALTGYRPARLLDQRFFDTDPDRTINRIQGYLEYNGARFAAEFDADRYLALSSALDRHRVDPASIRCRTELIGVDSDALVPVSQLRELAGAIGRRARLHLLDSPYGHDAFLKSPDLLNPLLSSLLTEPSREKFDVRA